MKCAIADRPECAISKFLWRNENAHWWYKLGSYAALSDKMPTQIKTISILHSSLKQSNLVQPLTNSEWLSVGLFYYALQRLCRVSTLDLKISIGSQPKMGSWSSLNCIITWCADLNYLRVSVQRFSWLRPLMFVRSYWLDNNAWSNVTNRAGHLQFFNATFVRAFENRGSQRFLWGRTKPALDKGCHWKGDR